MNTDPKEPRVNGAIKMREVRVIQEDGKQLGVIPTFQALKLAQDQGLDLVEIQPNVRPPVCKIMDFGRYKYQQKRKQAEQRKNQKIVELKEIDFHPNIEKHDLETKINKIREFIEDGNRVLLVIQFRGREMSHTDLGEGLLSRIVDSVRDIASPEKMPQMEGRDLRVIVAPAKKKQEKQQPVIETKIEVKQ